MLTLELIRYLRVAEAGRCGVTTALSGSRPGAVSTTLAEPCWMLPLGVTGRVNVPSAPTVATAVTVRHEELFSMGRSTWTFVPSGAVVRSPVAGFHRVVVPVSTARRSSQVVAARS